ncbi:MAG: hypothetical protein HPY65_15445 [Syntrophaceae bacterium]|nr:hypothetical protein [Syntrophaceae bacterium]
MKKRLQNAYAVKLFVLLILLCPTPVRAENSPQDLRTQACQAVFEIIAQCQATAAATMKTCTEIAKVLTSPETKGALRQQKPGDAPDALVEKTVTQVADMCSNACYRARAGKSYKTAREWIDGGGCTIEVTP